MGWIRERKGADYNILVGASALISPDNMPNNEKADLDCARGFRRTQTGGVKEGPYS